MRKSRRISPLELGARLHRSSPGGNAVKDFLSPQDGILVEIPPDLIDRNPSQPRKVFDPDGIRQLAASLKRDGVLQPVLVRRAGERYQLVAGERRWRAAKEAGLERLPAILTSRGDPIEVALVENLLREDLLPVDEADAFRHLVDQYDYTHAQLAEIIRTSESAARETLQLASLPPTIKADARARQFRLKKLLLQVARAKPDEQTALWERLRTGEVTVRGTARLTERPKRSDSPRPWRFQIARFGVRGELRFSRPLTAEEMAELPHEVIKALSAGEGREAAGVV